jgi:hypothetical protein
VQVPTTFRRYSPYLLGEYLDGAARMALVGGSASVIAALKPVAFALLVLMTPFELQVRGVGLPVAHVLMLTCCTDVLTCSRADVTC